MPQGPPNRWQRWFPAIWASLAHPVQFHWEKAEACPDLLNVCGRRYIPEHKKSPVKQRKTLGLSEAIILAIKGKEKEKTRIYLEMPPPRPWLEKKKKKTKVGKERSKLSSKKHYFASGIYHWKGNKSIGGIALPPLTSMPHATLQK